MITHPAPVFCFRREHREESGRQKSRDQIKEENIMTTAELATALPEIVTEQVPGPKSKELLDRRDAAIPKALCGKTYPICIKQGSGAMFEGYGRK